LSDWGKLQQVNGLIVSGGLSWPPDDSTAVTAGANAFEISVWQALLPLTISSTASIFENSTDNAKYSESTCDCVCMQKHGWAVKYSPDYQGGYQAYWLVRGNGTAVWWDPRPQPASACLPSSASPNTT
jgi:hypothetical protein